MRSGSSCAAQLSVVFEASRQLPASKECAANRAHQQNAALHSDRDACRAKLCRGSGCLSRLVGTMREQAQGVTSASKANDQCTRSRATPWSNHCDSSRTMDGQERARTCSLRACSKRAECFSMSRNASATSARTRPTARRTRRPGYQCHRSAGSANMNLVPVKLDRSAFVVNTVPMHISSH